MCDYCQWLEEILTRIKAAAKLEEERSLSNSVIIIHGPAGDIPSSIRENMVQEVKNVAVKAYEELLEGRSSLDVVEEAIRCMESKNYLNNALNLRDELIANASIMSKDYRVGSVGAIRNKSHPISLARKVLDNARHVLVVDCADDQYSNPQKCNYSTCRNFSESNDKQSKEEGNLGDEESKGENDSRDCLEQDSFVSFRDNGVGAIALDNAQTLSAGNSLIRESAIPLDDIRATASIIGCGIYVEGNACSSVSGQDKAIYSHAPARKIVRALQNNNQTNANLAVQAEVNNLAEIAGTNDVGVAALNIDGQVSICFKSTHFPWAYCYKNRLYYGSKENEKLSETIDAKKTGKCTCSF